MQKLKIGIDTTYMDRRQGKGTAIVIRHTVEELLKYRDIFDITLIHREEIPEDPLYTEFKEIIIPRLNLPKFSKFFSELWFFLTTKERFDIYYFSYSRLYPTFWLAPAKKIMFAAMDGGPETAGYTEVWAKGKQPWYIRLFLGSVDAFIAITEFGKKGIVESYGVAKEKVHVVYNGVDDRFMPPSLPVEVIRSILKEKYNFPEHYILCVSRFDPHKNILRLLEAYRTLVEDGAKYHLVFVGGKHMPEYSAQVDAYIKSHDLTQHVFTAPYIEEEDMPMVYQGAKLLVFPSLYEGFGLPVVEAMRCGTPVVISQIDALREVSNDLGELVDPYDNVSLASGIKKCLSVEADKGRMEQGIRWSERFTWEAHGLAIVKLFQELGAKSTI